MSRFLALLSCAFLLLPVTAQDRSVHEVRAKIDQMFDGMRAGDSTAVRDVFAPGARLVSSGNRPDGTPVMQASDIDGFVTAVGSPQDRAWNEKIWNVEIDVQDNLASAWMEYAFFLDEDFSHCGVNHFQFARNSEGAWKAIALADTRAREACDLDPVDLATSEVETALRHYLRGHATGDGSHHEMVFNPVASLYWMRDGELNTRSSEAYIAGASGSPADNESDRFRYVDWVDVSGDAAVGRIVLDYPGAYIVDYMSLLKIDGRWQIVNKIFSVEN
ncbi:MAG: nuclear transport factor 2 family protein [Rhodothermales bacterium]|nr:nuclear transport factor 2 family protein [Rhodothermales bacterium]MBO6781162.1 nuclear transport factor 2 family protein [Rhodothermales bacterium]